ncbi:MAG TPA: c-type cytochrome biogenesis protein CcsB [Candidatus Elarobacter sp.]|nr:c-type cytochrome biogenesis protein CcsB [Dongiaceae bacterium]HZW52851.1 c-type cytochrome biogenesis protein CcsB [Candidatus Elarobacter sp.]
MDPVRVHIDQALLVVGIAAYVTGALVLLAYFLLRTPLLRTIGIPLAALGAAAQFAELGTRWWMTGVWPLTNLYGSLSLFSACAVTVFLVFALRYDLAFIGGPVLGMAAIALGYATTWNEGYMPAVPALQSYWIKIHVPIVITAYASFMVAFCVALIHLVKAAAESRYARRGSAVRGAAAGAGGPNVGVTMSAYAANPAPGTVLGARRGDTPAIDTAAASGDATAQWLAGLPSLARLDVMQYRIVAVGLPLLSLGIITGAMWAKEAWGAYWQWDPKETAALFSWIVYAAYMHLHTRPDWRGTRGAWLNVFGFASIVFCYLGVNIWISGLHSYKM